MFLPLQILEITAFTEPKKHLYIFKLSNKILGSSTIIPCLHTLVFLNSLKLSFSTGKYTRKYFENSKRCFQNFLNI